MVKYVVIKEKSFKQYLKQLHAEDSEKSLHSYLKLKPDQKASFVELEPGVCDLYIMRSWWIKFTNIDLCGADLKGVDFFGVNLSKSNLAYTKLTDANIHKATLENTILIGAELTDDQLEVAKKKGAITTFGELHDRIQNNGFFIATNQCKWLSTSKLEAEKVKLLYMAHKYDTQSAFSSMPIELMHTVTSSMQANHWLDKILIAHKMLHTDKEVDNGNKVEKYLKSAKHYVLHNAKAVLPHR